MQKLALALLLALSAFQLGVLAEPSASGMSLRQTSHSAAHQRRELWGTNWYNVLLYHLHICKDDMSDSHPFKSHCEHHKPAHHHHSGGGGGGGGSSGGGSSGGSSSNCDDCDCAEDDEDCSCSCGDNDGYDVENVEWDNDGYDTENVEWDDDGHDDDEWADDGHDDDQWADDGHDDDEWDDDGHSSSYLTANGSQSGYHSAENGNGKRRFWIFGALAACVVGGLAFLASRKRKRNQSREVPQDVYVESGHREREREMEMTQNTKLSRTQSLKLAIAAKSAQMKNKFRRSQGPEDVGGEGGQGAYNAPASPAWENESIETNEHGVML